jgi:hypothetical protein
VYNAAELHREIVGGRIAETEGQIVRMAKSGTIIHSVHSAKISDVVTEFAMVSISTSVEGKTISWKTYACSLEQLKEEFEKGSTQS